MLCSAYGPICYKKYIFPLRIHNLNFCKIIKITWEYFFFISSCMAGVVRINFKLKRFSIILQEFIFQF